MFSKNKFLLLATTLTFFTVPVFAMDQPEKSRVPSQKATTTISPEERAVAQKLKREERRLQEAEEERQRTELQKALKGAIDSGKFKIEERQYSAPTIPVPENVKFFQENEAIKKLCMETHPWFKEWIENPEQARKNAFQPTHPMYNELGKVLPVHPEFKKQSFTNPLHPYFLVAARHDDKHPLYKVFSHIDPEHEDYFEIKDEKGSFKTNHPYYKLRWAEDPTFEDFPSPSPTEHPQFLVNLFYKDFGKPNRLEGPRHNYFRAYSQYLGNENHPEHWTGADKPYHIAHEKAKELGITQEDVNLLLNQKLCVANDHPLYYLAVRTNPHHPDYAKAALTDSWHPLYLAKAWSDPQHEKFWEFAERHPHHPGSSILSVTEGHFLYARSIRQAPLGYTSDLELRDPLHPCFYSRAWKEPAHCLYWKLAEIYPFHPGYGKTPQK